MKKIWMSEEIHEQPRILENIWEKREMLLRLVQNRKISKTSWVLFTAFGSSYHAALYGQFLFYRFLGIPSLVATPGFFLNSKKKLKVQSPLVVAISQSGKVMDVIETVRLLKKQGAYTLALTNNPDSPLACLCHEIVPLGAGQEKSVPATKTFTATLFCLELLAAYWGALPLLKNLAKIPGMASEILNGKAAIRFLAEKLKTKSRGFVLAPESLKAIAKEGALKLNECAYLMMEPFEWKEFFHGPVALAERETAAILLKQPDDLRTAAFLEKFLRKLGVGAYRLDAIPAFSKVFSKIRDSNTAAIPYTVLLQLLALYLGMAKGHNPDHPRHLHKITQAPG